MSVRWPRWRSWARAAVGFGVSLLGYLAWGLFVLIHVSRVAAEERASPDPGPDSAAASWWFIDLVLTPCVISPFLLVGTVLSCYRTRRPYGIGMVIGAVLPMVIAVAYLRYQAHQLAELTEH